MNQSAATEADGYSINATEFADGIEVQVRLPQGTQVGDTVTLTLKPATGAYITVDYSSSVRFKWYRS
ncbi:hypothetical protein INT80_12480 [Gallibacterium anatis]|uniref:Uncharacterized protein n=1 Tax=Gallibacterium anatis TaxID=750 RepID=A0A930UXK4_9PAST|nr:hypothetical protein [Gallibacterium anatis]